MADFNYQRLIIGYHGCDAMVASRILDGEGILIPSEKDYDWLGKGVYFWEHGPQRAFEWASAKSKRKNSSIKTPGVLGALINLGDCFDLLDVANTTLLKASYDEFARIVSQSGASLPANEPGHANDTDNIFRKLDCAMINWTLDKLKENGRSYHTVRGVFAEGSAAYPGGSIMLKSHIQIAVRDQGCISGFFKPNLKSAHGGRP